MPATTHCCSSRRRGRLRPGVATLAALVISAAIAHAQRAPRIGYIYPAGGQQGTTFEVAVGGQYLDDPLGAVVSGGGVEVEILEHDKPPPQQAINDIREKLREMQSKMRALRKGGEIAGAEVLPAIRRLLREAGLSEKDLRHLAEFDRKRNDPKQQLNTQISETVRARVTVSANAEPGIRYWRLRTSRGLGNPMRFFVGQQPEIREAEPEWEFDFEHYGGGATSPKKKGRAEPFASAPLTAPVSLPVTINGRILPGEVDAFTFHAKKGEQIVLAVQARNLIPYLPDAVPGWFQSVVSVRDASGREVAYSDGYRFDPDPVLFYKIPDDGDYHIRVHDSIYRGREDFVYRISVGELPFLTGISPLGAKAGSSLDITFQGGNLGGKNRQPYVAPTRTGITLVQAANDRWRSNSIPFHVDDLPEETEREPNNGPVGTSELKPPVVVNGRIDAPGDADFYRIKGLGNKPMVFEIFARRLGSPLDSNLTVFDAGGRQIAFNDDHEDPASGLTTHHADSRVSVKAPNTGICIVRVADTQNQGGPGNGYRLRITQGRPAFALRVTPSSLNARPGGTARLTVHVVRLDGFDGEIALRLKGNPGYFEIKNARVPAGQDHADISLGVPATETEAPVVLAIEGSAVVEGDPVVVDAVPAEDMMQAFIYRHLVPVDALLVEVRTPPEKPAR